MGEARRCHGRHSTAGDQSLSACANQGYARLTGARPCDRTAARSVTRYDARSSAISGSDREKCRRRQPSSSPATYAPTACTAPPSASRLHETNTMHCEEGARTSASQRRRSRHGTKASSTKCPMTAVATAPDNGRQRHVDRTKSGFTARGGADTVFVKVAVGPTLIVSWFFFHRRALLLWYGTARFTAGIACHVAASPIPQPWRRVRRS